MYRITILLGVCLIGAPMAHADESPLLQSAKKPKKFSIDFSLGVRPDMASLGSTISQDGTIDTADTTMANLVYSTGQALMSDRNNLVLWHNSQHTDSSFRLLGEEPEVGGSMLGLDLGTSLQYELDDIVKFPLYIRAGFHYTRRIIGGSQRRVLGDAAQANPTIAGLLAANGEDPANYIGGVMTSDYHATWIEVPITLGIRVPIKDGHSFAYGGIGVSFFRGGFQVDVDIDERYANVLATHVDVDAATVTNLSPGAVEDELDFVIGSAGLNWLLGAQTRIGSSSAALFIELNASGAAKTVYSSPLKPETQQLLTATSSQTLASEDPQWFKRLAFPVLTTGASVRVGLRYYIF